VTTVLVPKLGVLATLLSAQFSDALRMIVVFVPGERRAKTLRETLRKSLVPVTVELVTETGE
jgi:hypothetical protein